jgi:hypothetical protein
MTIRPCSFTSHTLWPAAAKCGSQNCSVTRYVPSGTRKR